MDFERFKMQLEQADNDSLVASLVEHSKKMDSDVVYYEAVKVIKTELLKRLDGEPVEQTDWKDELTAKQEQAVLDQYQHGVSISTIQKDLGDNVAQKAVRLAIAKVYGTEMECERCRVTAHIAHVIGEQVACVQCGTIKK